jgi:DNA polymerase-4
VTKISGVGPKTAQLLEGVGVRTIGELAQFPGSELKKLMGKNSVWLWAIARGVEELPVEERPDPKSISVERTFDKDVTDWTKVESTIRDVARNVFLRARGQGATFRTVGIKIRLEGFQTHLRERTLASHVLDEKVLADVCVELAEEFAGGNHRIRLIGVRVTKLERPKTRQPQLTAFE